MSARPRRRLYTPRELSAYWSVSKRTVIRAIEKGALPARKIGKQWRIPKGSAVRYGGSVPDDDHDRT